MGGAKMKFTKRGIALGLAAFSCQSLVGCEQATGTSEASAVGGTKSEVATSVPDAVTGNGVFPYVDTSELGALRMFGRSSEAQQAVGGKQASIIFSPSQTTETFDGVRMVDGSNGISCTLPKEQYAQLAALPNPFPIVQGRFGIFRPDGEVEIENCQIVTVDGGQWEADYKAGKFPTVGKIKTTLSE